MIHQCNCTGGSSSFENHNHPYDLKLCKICGGKLTVSSQEAQSGNMVTMGLELPRLIDPRVNWRSATKGRQRAVRRARTSFTGENGRKSPAVTLKGNENATNQQLKRTGEIPVAESEELGVTLLGRRFSDGIESVPIKKRRLKLVCSPSPPSHSSQLHDSEQIFQSYTTYNRDGLSCGDHHPEQTNVKESTCRKGTNKEQLDSVDFSGISILAAAACESGMVSDIGNTLCQGHSFEGEKLLADMPSAESSSFGVIKQERQLHATEDLYGKCDTPSTISVSALQAKGSDDTELDSVNNPDISTGCSQNVSEKMRRVENPSRDSRLHWDLNTIMDVWETNPDDENANTEPNASDIVSKNGDPVGRVESDPTCQDPVRYEDAKVTPYAFDGGVQVVGIPKGDDESHYYVAQDKCDEHNSSLPRGNELPQNIPHLEHASVRLSISSTEADLFSDQQKITRASEAESTLPRGSLLPLSQSSAMAAVMEKPKDNTCSYSPTENGCSVSHVVTAKDFEPNFSAQMCEIESEMDLSVSKLVSEDSTDAGEAAVLNKSFADCNQNDLRVGEGTQSLSVVEKTPCIDSGSSIEDHCPPVILLPDNSPRVLVDGQGCADMTACVGVPFSAHPDGLRESENALKVHMSLHPNNGVVPHYQDKPASSEIETAEDMKVDDTKSHSKHYANVDHTNTDGAADIVSQPFIPSLEETVSALVGADGVSIYASTNVALDNQVPCGYDLGSSHIDVEQAVGMEKIDLEDDDSQYEDGELREYAPQSWEVGYEEVETEPVDYGSDYREYDIFEAAPDIPTSTCLPVDIRAQIKGGLSVASNDGLQSGQGSDAAVPQMLQKCSSLSSRFNSGSEKGAAGVDIEKILRDHLRGKDTCERPDKHVKNATESSAIANGFNSRSAGTKVLSSSLKMKSSGWDRLPAGTRSERGLSARVNSAGQSALASSLDASQSRNSMRRPGSLSRDLLSQTKRRKSFDRLHKDDSSYINPSRSDGDDHRRRNGGAPRLIARNESPHHTRASIRGEPWVKAPNCSGSSRHTTPDYYGRCSFAPASRDAAAAAVAKVESNGFVVAPDGTIIKAVGTVIGCRMRRSVNTPVHDPHPSLSGREPLVKRDEACAREMSPDRHFGVGRGRSGRYDLEINRDVFHRPDPDDRMGSSLSVHQALSRRQRSFSPHRGSLNISRSCTRSPSRSRTRSPHLWSSPRGRGDVRMNGSFNQRRCSRSPKFKSESRMERMGSPSRCSNFDDRMVGYCSLPRNHAFSPRASKWVDERKCSSAYPREHNYKQCAGRSPPLVAFSGGDRFDLHEEYYRSMPSSRFRGYGGDRGNRRDGSGDDSREIHDKYEMYQSVRQFDRNDRAKQFRNDVGDDFRSRNSKTRPSEIQSRGSSKSFERSSQKRPRDSPRGAKEERDHYKCRGRKRDDTFKQYELEDCGDDKTARRRPEKC